MLYIYKDILYKIGKFAVLLNFILLHVTNVFTLGIFYKVKLKKIK